MSIIEGKILDFAEARWGKKTIIALVAKLAEEAGEVAGACVKIGENRAEVPDLLDELGDVLIVVAQFAAKHDTTIDALMRDRFAMIKRRAEQLDNLKEAEGRLHGQ